MNGLWEVGPGGQLLVSMGFGVNCLTPLSYTSLIGRMEPFTSHGYFEHDLGLVNKKHFASYEQCLGGA